MIVNAKPKVNEEEFFYYNGNDEELIKWIDNRVETKYNDYGLICYKFLLWVQFQVNTYIHIYGEYNLAVHSIESFNEMFEKVGE